MLFFFWSFLSSPTNLFPKCAHSFYFYHIVLNSTIPKKKMEESMDYILAHLKLLIRGVRTAWFCEKAVFDRHGVRHFVLPSTMQYLMFDSETILIIRTDLWHGTVPRDPESIGKVLGYIQPMMKASEIGDTKILWMVSTPHNQISLWCEFLCYSKENLQRVMDRYQTLCDTFAPMQVHYLISRWTSKDTSNRFCPCPHC